MFHKLHIYTVHLRPGKRIDEDYPEFVREGFNVWAFLLTVFWAFYHRLWLVAACIVALNVSITFLRKEGIITEPSALILLAGAQLIIGFHGNDWRRAKLKRRGYITAGVTTGETTMRAEQRFFDQYLSSPQAA